MSELKSILLHVDAAANTAQRLAFARRLAQARGARIEAMYAVMPAVLQYPFAFTADGTGAALLMNYESEQRTRVKAAFEQDCRGAGDSAAVPWHEATDDPVRAFTQ